MHGAGFVKLAGKGAMQCVFGMERLGFSSHL